MKKIRKAKSLFAGLSQANKGMIIGSFLTIVSLFLPWYHDMDAWGKGATYLGITGPLSIIGLIILIGSSAVFAKIIGQMMGKEMRFLKKFKNLAFYVAAENIILFVIAASIYFDPKFGVNITLKETAFGLFLCLIGSVMMGLGEDMKNHEPAERELNVFEEVERNIDRMHKDIARDELAEVPLAEREYREKQTAEAAAEEKAETLRMDL